MSESENPGFSCSLLLIRHGQSEWNAAGRWQGRADPPLTALGRHQAEAAAQAIGSCDMVVSSPLCRAAETAEIIAEHHGSKPVLTDPDLVERDAGEWQGLTRAEIEVAWPGYLENRKRPPGYEPDKAMMDRVSAALLRIGALAENCEIVVVAHGGVVYTLEDAHGEPWRRVPNLGGRWLQICNGSIELGQRVDLVADGTTPDLF